MQSITMELPKNVGVRSVLPAFMTPAVARAAKKLVDDCSDLVRGAILGPTVNVSGDGDHLTGYAVGIQTDKAISAQFLDMALGGLQTQRSPMLSTLGIYEVIGLDDTVPLDVKELRVRKDALKEIFEKARAIAERSRSAGVRLSTPSDGSGDDMLAIDAFPLDDRQSVTVTQSRIARDRRWHIVVATALPGVSEDLATLIVQNKLNVVDLLARPEWQRARDLNAMYNARVAKIAANALNLPVNTLSSTVPGKDLAQPINTWSSNTFNLINVSAKVKPESTEDIAKRKGLDSLLDDDAAHRVIPSDGSVPATPSSSSKEPVVAQMGVFYQRTHDTSASQGAVLGMGPLVGYEWHKGPAETAPTGASAEYGGNWRHEATINMFPTGAGRVKRWAEVDSNSIGERDRRIMSQRLAVGGTYGVTRRAAGVYAPSVTSEMRQALEGLGWDSDDGSITMEAELTYMGPPPDRQITSVKYLLAWAPKDQTNLPVRLDDRVVHSMLDAYVKAARTGAGLAAAFDGYDMATLFAQESGDKQSVLLPRALVQKLSDLVEDEGGWR